MARFLETDCSVLAMVDDDIVPPPMFLESLDPFLPEYGMVSVPHPMPAPSDTSVLGLTGFRRGSDGLTQITLQPGMNDCDAIATGCVLVSRAAVEAVGVNPFRIENDPTAAVTSDDFLFCADLQKAGFKIGCWWDGQPCDHISAVSLGPLLESQYGARR